MLDATEPLLFRRSNKLAVADERGRGITVESIKPQNDHTRPTKLESADLSDGTERSCHNGASGNGWEVAPRYGPGVWELSVVAWKVAQRYGSGDLELSVVAWEVARRWRTVLPKARTLKMVSVRRSEGGHIAQATAARIPV